MGKRRSLVLPAWLAQKPSLSNLMLTQRITPAQFEQVIEILRSGGIVGVPTETVYGLAADARNEAAVKKIFLAKERPLGNPLIVHVASVEHALQFSEIQFDWIERCMKSFSPGPITFVLPQKKGLAHSVTAGLPTVAIRIPDHPTLRNILEQSQLPLAAPSANHSGRPSATTWQAVVEDLDSRIDAIICDEPCHWGLESTVVDATTEQPIILRPGAISLEQLQRVAPNCIQANANTPLAARSPGTRFRHYQPRATVCLVNNFEELTNRAIPMTSTAIGLTADLSTFQARFAHSLLCIDVPTYAKSLYEFFRKSDETNATHIFCQRVAESDIGAALMDRLQRASDQS